MKYLHENVKRQTDAALLKWMGWTAGSILPGRELRAKGSDLDEHAKGSDLDEQL